MAQLALYLAVGLTVSFAVLIMALPLFLRPSLQEQRLRTAVSLTSQPRLGPSSREALEQSALQLASWLRARIGVSLSERSRKRLIAAGYRTTAAQELFFAFCWFTPLAFAFIGSFTQNAVFNACIGAALGYIAPDFILSNRVNRRRDRIRRGLPDATDLLVICVDAGLGLDQAILRVGEEIAHSCPEIHEEFHRIHQEQRAGQPRTAAWQALAERTQLEEFRTFATMLVQADRFGTPIARALTRYSDDLRTQRRQRAEEAGAKTKIKILFPLVFFIFPSLFIVLLAPALLSLMAELGGVGK